MPLLSHTPTPILLPVSDRVNGNTRLKQKALFLRQEHEQKPDTAESSAKILVRVTLYAADDAAPDGYGPMMTGPGFTAYTAELVADNNTLVNPATGQILAIRPAFGSDADWQATIESFPYTTMLQGDYFELLRRYSPIDIEEMIVEHIMQADAMGRFA